MFLHTRQEEKMPTTTMPTTAELREKSRLLLQSAMQKKRRWLRHKLARQALDLVRLAEKVDGDNARMQAKQAP